MTGHAVRAHPPVPKKGGAIMATKKESVGRTQARRRQELRRCNAAVAIPAADHKRSRSWARQQLREEWR